MFELANGEKYIHCGDMRFGQHLLQDPHLKHFQNANAVFLDTTYCNPRFTFPPQVQILNSYSCVSCHNPLQHQKPVQVHAVLASVCLVGIEEETCTGNNTNDTNESLP